MKVGNEIKGFQISNKNKICLKRYNILVIISIAKFCFEEFLEIFRNLF